MELKKELTALEREGGRRDARNRAAIGKLLGEAQASLEHGDWLTFVAEHSPYTQRSAHRYMAVHQLSVDRPVAYHDLRHLGARSCISSRRWMTRPGASCFAPKPTRCPVASGGPETHRQHRSRRLIGQPPYPIEAVVPAAGAGRSPTGSTVPGPPHRAATLPAGSAGPSVPRRPAVQSAGGLWTSAAK